MEAGYASFVRVLTNRRIFMLKRPLPVLVLLALSCGAEIRPALGNSISMSKGQMPAGPLGDAVNTGVKALQQRVKGE